MEGGNNKVSRLRGSNKLLKILSGSECMYMYVIEVEVNVFLELTYETM